MRSNWRKRIQTEESPEFRNGEYFEFDKTKPIWLTNPSLIKILSKKNKQTLDKMLTFADEKVLSH